MSPLIPGRIYITEKAGTSAVDEEELLMADVRVFREKLKEIVVDQEQMEAICNLFESLGRLEEAERRKRQMDGIKRAKEEGKTLGRPKIKEPENFSEIVQRWEEKKITAVTAAIACNVGVSTFYRWVRSLKDLQNSEGRGKHVRKI